MFIPDYRDGEAPFGIWTPKRLLVAPQWISSSDPALDVGFVVLEPNDGRNVEDVLGASTLGIDPPYQQIVRVTGYPGQQGGDTASVSYSACLSQAVLRLYQQAAAVTP